MCNDMYIMALQRRCPLNGRVEKIWTSDRGNCHRQLAEDIVQSKLNTWLQREQQEAPLSRCCLLSCSLDALRERVLSLFQTRYLAK